ncbi:hypothetical protein PILCRDRAFT_816730 [Piloderma croceum F 1598]|uniref:Uncharacterized protein n=1 Tax=Piloderma croceum (strain F 1598) TaxID=765440 RepID=A0A0C3G6A6_PILCF|nr:hypothetical protein PILCRDRAFT_816730 [Piloderma croceum F 1598]
MTSDRLARENLHPTTEMEDKVKGQFRRRVVIREGAFILKLVAGEDKMSLVRRDAI